MSEKNDDPEIFVLGQVVYHVADQHAGAGVVTGIVDRKTHHSYLVRWSTCEESESLGYCLSPEPCYEEGAWIEIDQEP